MQLDDEDYEWLNQHFWWVNIINGNSYVFRDVWEENNEKRIYMHRVILGLTEEDKVLVDHKDMNGLNNQKSNLRECTATQNGQNRPKNRNNTSGYKGVCYRKDSPKTPWTARIVVNGKQTSLGLFSDPGSASEAYKQAALKYHGEFANTGEA